MRSRPDAAAWKAGRRDTPVVVCTDGLWNYAPDADELAQLDGDAPPQEPLALAHSLVDVALHAGGHDNVTVVVLDVDPQRDEPSSPSPHEEREP